MSNFHQQLDAAILAGRSSQENARAFGVRSETVRNRRKMLRFSGYCFPNIEAPNARRTKARNSAS